MVKKQEQKKEMSQEEYNLALANEVIQELQAEIGGLHGRLAQANTRVRHLSQLLERKEGEESNKKGA